MPNISFELLRLNRSSSNQDKLTHISYFDAIANQFGSTYRSSTVFAKNLKFLCKLSKRIRKLNGFVDDDWGSNTVDKHYYFLKLLGFKIIFKCIKGSVVDL